MIGQQAKASKADQALPIGRGTAKHELVTKAHEMRLAAVGEHFAEVVHDAERLASVIAENAAFGLDLTGDFSKAMIAAQDGMDIIHNTWQTYRGEQWPVPLDLEAAQALLMICKTFKAGTSLVATWSWEVLRALGLESQADELLRPLQTKAMDLAVDAHWLSSLVSHMIDVEGATRMQRHRARRRARLRQATVHFHENEVKTLEKIGLLSTGAKHEAGDVERAISTFVSMSFELAENAAIEARRSTGKASAAQAWGNLMTDFLAAGRSSGDV